MADWFEWKGIRCTDYGIHVSQQPEITVPSERISSITIPGRAGSLHTKDGENIYDSFQIPITCFVENMNNKDDIIRWLRGSGKLVIPRRPDGYYRARLDNQIPFALVLRGLEFRSLSLTFDCQPFFYYHVGENEINVTSGMSLSSPSDAPCIVESMPGITIESDGAAVNDTYILIDDKVLYISSFSDNISIDTENGVAYSFASDGSIINMCNNISIGEVTDPSGGQSSYEASFSISDDFPSIRPDMPNIIRFVNGDDIALSVRVTPYWRTL